MDPQIAEQMRSTITIVTAGSSADAYGQRTSSTGVTRTVFWTDKFQLIRDTAGHQVVSQHQFISDSAVNMSDTIWRPGDSTTSSTGLGITPLAVAGYTDELGADDYWRVWM